MVKPVSLSNEAYEVLHRMKKENESFSDVILRTFKYRKKSNLMELTGAWKNNPDIVKIMNGIYKERKNFKLRM